MKWVIIAAIPPSVVLLAMFLRRNDSFAPVVYSVIGLGLFFQRAPHATFAIVSWPEWVGFSTGLEISFLDLLVAALWLALPTRSSPIPGKLAGGLYLAAVALSIGYAAEPLPSVFYLWQVVRIYFFCSIILRLSADIRFLPAMFVGITSGLCIEVTLVCWQKFALQIVQPSGTFRHQNMLGMIAYTVTIPMFALLLAGRFVKLATIASVACFTIISLVASRGSLIFAGAGILFVLLGSILFRGLTSWKGLVLVCVICSAALVIPLSIASIDERFAVSGGTRQYDERAALEYAAKLIFDENPMGVGANNFAHAAGIEGYFRRAMVSNATLTALMPHVHNAYWLAAVETGYLGLLSFAILLFNPLWTTLVSVWRYRGRDASIDLHLGLGVALLMIYLHSFVEWILVTAEIQYFLATLFGLVFGNAFKLSTLDRSVARYSSVLSTRI